MYSKKFIPILSLFLLGFVLQSSYAQEKTRFEELFKISLEELMNLTITTAGKQEEKISDVPASVVVITRADIEKYGYQDLAEILLNVPGLFMINDYTERNFGVRGFWTSSPNRNMVILVNGVRQTEDLDLGHPLSFINVPVDAIDRIEIVRGPMSVIYGSGAFFGVVNIITNNSSDQEGNSLVSASYGSMNSTKIALRVAGEQGDLKYAFNGSFYKTDGLDVAYSDLISDPSILPAFGVAENLKTGGLLKTSEAYFNFSGTFKKFTFDLSYTVTPRGVSILLPPVSDDGMTMENSAVRMYLGYKNDLSRNLRFETKLGYFMNRRHYFHYDFYFENFYGWQDDQTAGFEAEASLFYEPSDQIKMQFGAELRSVQYVSNDLTVPLFEIDVNYTLKKESHKSELIFRSDRLEIFGLPENGRRSQGGIYTRFLFGTSS